MAAPSQNADVNNAGTSSTLSSELLPERVMMLGGEARPQRAARQLILGSPTSFHDTHLSLRPGFSVYTLYIIL